MYRGSLSKFSLHLLSSVMLTNTRGTQDLWISEMSGTFFLYIIHPHPLCAPTICYPRPGTHTHTQTLQFVFLSLQVTSSGWAQKFMSLSVNMQRLQWAEGVKRAADNAWCVSDVCSHVQDKDWVGGGVGLVIHRASELGHNGIKNTDGIIQSSVCGAYTGKI